MNSNENDINIKYKNEHVSVSNRTGGYFKKLTKQKFKKINS